MTDNRRQFKILLRHNLYAFIRKVFQGVNPGAEFLDNWHVETLAWQLQKVAEGEINRLIITVPPRHLKSICASVALPAWLLGRDPALNVICVSYNNNLAEKHARDFRTVVGETWYKGLFTRMRINPRKNTEMEVVTTRNGGRLATSVGGTLTGRGGDVIIIDDPIKPDGVMSESERANVNEWFRHTLYSRLNSKRDGRIVIVTQRLHEDDLVGSLLEEQAEHWTVLNIPAIAPEPMTYRTGDEPDDVYHRAAGEVIDPRREDEAELERIRRNLGSINFAAQYQQEPQPLEGNMVKRDWFRFYDDALDVDELDAIVQSWDTAGAAGELNDYTVCTTWGVQGPDYYLLDVLREKLDYPDLRRKAIEMVRRHQADIVVVELAGTGQSLIQDLRESVDAFVLGIRPRGDKETRLAAQSALIEQGRVYLPASALWLDTFLKEVLGFPSGRHDDQVDSMELFLKYIRGGRGLERRGKKKWPHRQRPSVRPRSTRGERPAGAPLRRFGRRRLVEYGPAPTLCFR